MPKEPISAIGSERLTVDATVGGVALTVPSAARRAVITVETAEMRFTEDTTAPTTTRGHLVNIGDVIKYMDNDWRGALLNWRGIRTTATSAVVEATYYV